MVGSHYTTALLYSDVTVSYDCVNMAECLFHMISNKVAGSLSQLVSVRAEYHDSERNIS